MRGRRRRPREGRGPTILRVVGSAALLATILLGCGGEPPRSTPGSSPLDDATLRYRVIDALGVPAFCDPDVYPVGRDELVGMRERFPEIERDLATLTAIRTRVGIPAGAALTDEQRLAIYREWKVLQAVDVSADAGAFDVIVDLDPGTDVGTRVIGTVEPDGTVVVASRTPGAPLTCPICLVSGTRIATPEGTIPVEEVQPGMTVWSMDLDGNRTRATVERIGRTPVPDSHRVVTISLADGRSVTASPGHPVFDGRLVGTLGPGDPLDGSHVVAVSVQGYGARWTYDLVPSGVTRTYIADGIPLRSTLVGE